VYVLQLKLPVDPPGRQCTHTLQPFNFWHAAQQKDADGDSGIAGPTRFTASDQH
jgi:hypothetical protein